MPRAAASFKSAWAETHTQLNTLRLKLLQIARKEGMNYYL